MSCEDANSNTQLRERKFKRTKLRSSDNKAKNYFDVDQMVAYIAENTYSAVAVMFPWLCSPDKAATGSLDRCQVSTSDRNPHYGRANGRPSASGCTFAGASTNIHPFRYTNSKRAS